MYSSDGSGHWSAANTVRAVCECVSTCHNMREGVGEKGEGDRQKGERRRKG